MGEETMWTDTLPDDLKSETLSKFQPTEGEDLVPVPSSLVKGYLGLEKKLGAGPDRILVKPSENATEEELAAFARALGVPESPESYELPLPEGAQMDERGKEVLGAFQKTVHGLGLTPDQARGMHEWALEMGANLDKANADARAEAEAAVKKEFGDEGLAAARKVVELTTGKEGLQRAEEEGMFLSPAALGILTKVAKEMGEERLKGLDGQPPPDSGGPKSRAELMKLMEDPRYSDEGKRDPEYVKMVTEEFRKSFPGQHILAPTEATR